MYCEIHITPTHGGFRVSPKIRQQIERRKREVARRLDKNINRGCDRPIMTASNIHYEIADRTRATAAGGIGAMHLLVRKLGLDEAIDRHLGLLKIHLPYHCSAATRRTWTPWEPAAFPTRPRPAISAAASTSPASIACSNCSTPRG